MRSLLLLLVPAIAHAEVEQKGLRVGAVVMSMSRENTMTGPGSEALISRPGGIVFGGFLTWRRSDTFAFQLEAEFSSKILRTEMCAPCVTTADLEFYYLEIPFLLRLDLLPNATKFHLDFGAEGVISLGGGKTPPGGEFERFDDLTPVNIGGVLGLGIEIPAGPGKIVLDARYKRWLAPINQVEDMVVNDPDPDEKITPSHQVMLTAGYAFP